jgi:hypothetical protein
LKKALAYWWLILAIAGPGLRPGWSGEVPPGFESGELVGPPLPRSAGVEAPEPEAAWPSSRNLTGRGLLDLQEPFPLARLHLQFPIDTLEVLDEGDSKFYFSFNLANTFVLEEDIEIDAETHSLQLGGWYAIRDDFYAGASLSLLGRGGGFLDPVVDSFHHALGLSDGGRSERGRSEYEIRIVDREGGVHTLERGLGLGDLTLKCHWIVSRGERWLPAVSLQPLMTVPTSTTGFGNDGIDVGLNVSFYKTVADFLHLYGVVGTGYFFDIETEGLRYERNVLQGVVGIEFLPVSEVSIVLQAMTFSPLLVESFPSELNRSRNYVAFGVKWEIVPKIELELSLIENLEPFESSTDISVNMGLFFTF